MKNIADSVGLPVLHWRTLYFESSLCSRYGDHKREVELLDSALAMVDSVTYEYDYHRMLWNRHLPDNWENYASSYSFIRKELKYYQEIGDEFMVALMYSNLGRIFSKAGVLEKEIHYHNLAYKIFRNLGYVDYCEHCKIEDVVRLWLQGKEEESKKLYIDCLTSPYFEEDTLSIYGLLMNAVYIRIDKNAAYKAYDLAHQYGKIQSILGGSALTLGSVLLEEGKIRQSIPYFYEALSVDLEGDIYKKDITYGAFRNLTEAYKHLGMIDSAFYFQSRAIQLSDSLDALNSQDAFIGDIERYLLMQEDEKFENERQHARWRLIIIIVSSAILLLFAGGVIWYLHMKRKLKEAEAERLASEKMAEQLQRELYQRQCEDQERKLTSNTLELMDKRNMIDHLNRQIQDSAKEGKIDQDVQRNLQNFIRTHNATEGDLQQFYEYFNQVHPAFLTTLKEKYPTLTKGELRLCALLRIGLDNKQIAHVLSIDDQSVKKARQRMRKKLPLSETDSLEDFLMLLTY